MTAVFGADEAGKGPVLGSMFAAAVAVDDPAVLPDGIDDSKKLSPSRRESLAESLREDDRVDIAVAEITPERIDAPETDMNTLTVVAQAEALAGVVADGMSGVVDAGDTSESRFGRRVADRLPATVDLTAEHGADEAHAAAGAASVVAKVERDAQMAAYAEEYGAVGSGYPSDATTREFLASHVEKTGCLPPFARESWSTCDDILAAAEQAGLEEF
ncbi:ribonuclease HII [Halostella pelagica]|uniref:ribonuclease HII n=1 Tax=Halostella pelagica TaxID=2583824 RepID=UPI0010800A0F|nr:ribonuclease HII [Halostella pelagica]